MDLHETLKWKYATLPSFDDRLTYRYKSGLWMAKTSARSLLLLLLLLRFL
jgi:hypothetical protein